MWTIPDVGCSALVYTVWISGHLDDHIKIFQSSRHSEGKINILGKMFPRPWFRTAFKQLGSLLFKTTRPLIIGATCGPGGRVWSPKSEALTTQSISLATFSITSFVHFQKDVRRWFFTAMNRSFSPLHSFLRLALCGHKLLDRSRTEPHVPCVCDCTSQSESVVHRQYK